MQDLVQEMVDAWHHQPTAFERASGLWPVRAGRNIAKPDYAIGPRFIECYSLHFVMSGQILFTSGNRQFSLTKGDLFCIFPNQIVTYRALSQQPPLRLCWLAFDGHLAAFLVQMMHINAQSPCRKQCFSADIELYLRRITNLFNGEEDYETVQRQSLMYQLFSQLVPENGGETPKKAPADWLKQSIAYMHIHYAERLTVENIASLVGVHRSHFSATFTAHMGIAPGRYLQCLRMKKAAQLLRETAYTVTEIALSLGYSDVYTFTKAFTTYFGMPPGKYRVRHLLI